MLPFQSKQMKLSTLKKMMGSPNFNLLLELHRLDGLGSKGLLETFEFLEIKKKEYSNKNILPQCFLSGDDLINMDITDGLIKDILDEIYKLQLDEIILSNKEAKEWVKQKYC